MTIILIDTNVLIDYLSGRDPYFKFADEIIQLCRDGKVVGYMSAHSVPNMFYILRKDYSADIRRIMIKSLFDILNVSGLDGNKLLTALNREDFKDFEDCLQDECAITVHAEYIVTINVKDYSFSSVKAVSPEKFVSIYKMCSGS